MVLHCTALREVDASLLQKSLVGLPLRVALSSMANKEMINLHLSGRFGIARNFLKRNKF